ncbi:chorismate-binding protein [Streptomyces sp. DSM 44917]|uniref:Chorismate-binding protein n=1 Tax=Streptomyces boetiae TaxID=3075541 RepID=A0ABU2LC37_9ACTN|nr:chorismate-binding protein [Streptomyces sp. DSM 44917]MDT0308818.1 chorismate-binding protein [Streptomyces sp. DSM 44917]
MHDVLPLARLGGFLATGLRDVTDDPAALESTGWWAVVAGFEGRLVCARFDRVVPAPAAPAAGWRGPGAGEWVSSLDREGYTAGVEAVRRQIAAGEVYQVNLCRVLTAPLPGGPGGPGQDIDALAGLLARRHPARYAGSVRLPAHGVEIATASPELFLRRDGRTVESGPIKGTATGAEALLPKDTAENVMITDLVRNDLGRVCSPGTVAVPGLCVPEPYPGLVHLVSTVRGELAPGAGWPRLLEGTFPPGSVTGAPKSSSLRVIRALEPVARGPYCGAVGWVDADRRTGELAVGIRTFWIDRTGGGPPLLRFGTGAGITWDSDPAGEWAETELKAARLIGVASEGQAASDPRGSHHGADLAGR